MEKFNDILENIGERIRSPLIFSFILSWLLVNWEIVVMLLWFNDELLVDKGFDFHIAFIAAKLNPWQCWQLPLIAAMSYTFGYPIIKNIISVHQTVISKFGYKAKLLVSKGASIPMDRYIEKVQSLAEREKFIENLIKNESLKLDEKDKFIRTLEEQIASTNDLNAQIIEKNRRGEDKIQEQQAEIANYDISNRVEVVKGSWSVNFGDRALHWLISDSGITQVDENNIQYQIGTIRHIYWNRDRSQSVFFLLHLSDDGMKNLYGTKKLFFELTSGPGNNNLVGSTLDGIKVRMTRR